MELELTEHMRQINEIIRKEVSRVKIQSKVKLFFLIYFVVLFFFISSPWTLVGIINKAEPFVGPFPWSVFCIMGALALVVAGMAIFQYLDEKYEGR